MQAGRKGRLMRTVILAFALTASPAAAQSFDFRGYALGSTVDEFRARPAPSGWRGGSTHAVCSDNETNQSWLTPSSDLVAAGVVNCGFVERIGTSIVRAGMPLTPLDHSATVRFSFYEDRLFRIETYMDAFVAGAIEEALTAKFGRPTMMNEGRFQTRAGAVFPQMVHVWRRDLQSVTMTTPDLTTERMSVIYLDEAAAADVELRAQVARNPAAVM